MGHTARYLAEKLRRKIALEEKRKAEGVPEDYEEPKPKKVKQEIEGTISGQIKSLKDKALRMLIDQMQEGTDALYKDLYGSQWKEGAAFEAARRAERQAEAARVAAALAESERQRKEDETVSLTGTGVYLDDYDPRY